jgi:predicted adenine nucleotide alpha hydrolase (AANH) superfamily ATPase
VRVLAERGADPAAGDLTGYFFNPNIHPPEEHARRLENAARLAALRGLPFEADPAYDEAPFRARMDDPCVHGDGTASPRCRACYALRMEAAAAQAARIGAEAFTTTLLVSPYQDREALREIGREAGRRHGVRFLEEDFRDGYREGQRMARADGLYRQRYCGCVASLAQRDQEG